MGAYTDAMRKTPAEMWLIMALAMGGVAYGSHYMTKKALMSPDPRMRRMGADPAGAAGDRMADNFKK
ncbi:hypothetical protein BC829DRAFT_441101 [Chytridium lagenaria]|nr:hypothetical protein BC829DRAFT_441101 [Chytridium lagenaria]